MDITDIIGQRVAGITHNSIILSNNIRIRTERAGAHLEGLLNGKRISDFQEEIYRDMQVTKIVPVSTVAGILLSDPEGDEELLVYGVWGVRYTNLVVYKRAPKKPDEPIKYDDPRIIGHRIIEGRIRNVVLDNGLIVDATGLGTYLRLLVNDEEIPLPGTMLKGAKIIGISTGPDNKHKALILKLLDGKIGTLSGIIGENKYTDLVILQRSIAGKSTTSAVEKPMRLIIKRNITDKNIVPERDLNREIEIYAPTLGGDPDFESFTPMDLYSRLRNLQWTYSRSRDMGMMGKLATLKRRLDEATSDSDFISIRDIMEQIPSTSGI